jgi:hypothetical protein
MRITVFTFCGSGKVTKYGKEKNGAQRFRCASYVHGRENTVLFFEGLSGTYQKNALDADGRDDNPAGLPSVEGIPCSLPQERL